MSCVHHIMEDLWHTHTHPLVSENIWAPTPLWNTLKELFCNVCVVIDISHDAFQQSGEKGREFVAFNQWWVYKCIKIAGWVKHIMNRGAFMMMISLIQNMTAETTIMIDNNNSMWSMWLQLYVTYCAGNILRLNIACHECVACILYVTSVTSCHQVYYSLL